MPVSRNARAVDTAGDVHFSERLYLPWWGWPLPLAGAVLLAAEIHMGYPGVRSWLPYLLLVPLVVVTMLWLGRRQVQVKGGELWVGEAHLPLEFVGRVTVLDAEEKRPALGRDLDPAAFVAHQGWVGPAVLVELTDPDDPTPYWIFSVRQAEKLAGLLRELAAKSAR
ncbi:MULTISPECIES: DUF3093 domain-containing protein [unclassified Crossiella]|uniref:DUF3093 domain-containing protein n=1 Tax=unclassified Crossiella TaxID=2620835 RepID=UPI001FFEEF84|nr:MULTISPECIES: DUF3093 domain-containing protein [unclassified Crossiella]MCK2240428.1 DUF3093 domain-containing protein [Crossiella sp. S99.2]MCK2253120.1 DUF3093 domain-containing protein [Crossiella sp. S99.1]